MMPPPTTTISPTSCCTRQTSSSSWASLGSGDEWREKIAKAESAVAAAEGRNAAEWARQDAEIAALESAVAALKKAPPPEPEKEPSSCFATLSTMNAEIRENFDKAFGRIDDLLVARERDMLRAFKARLFDRHQELWAARTVRDQKASSWIKKVRGLEADAAYAKETREALERNRERLGLENKDLRKKAARASEDRKLLINDLVLSKKRALALREEIARLDDEEPEGEEHGPSSTRRARGIDNKPRRPPLVPPEVTRLRRAIEEERATLFACKQDYAAGLRSSTDLRELLRLYIKCLRARLDERRCRKARPLSAPVLKRPTSVTTRKGDPPAPLEFWDFASAIGGRRAAGGGDRDQTRGAWQPPPKKSAAWHEPALRDFDLQLRVVTRLAHLTFPDEEEEEEEEYDEDDGNKKKKIRKQPRSSRRPHSASPAAARPSTAALPCRGVVKERPPRPKTSHGAARFSSLRRGAAGEAVRFASVPP